MVSGRPADSNQPRSDSPGGRTVLATPLADRLALIVGLPALLVLIGLVLPVFARWLLDLSQGLPARPVWRLLGSVDEPREVAVHLAIWLVLGLLIALTKVKGSTRVTLTDTEVQIRKGDRSQTVARSDVAAVFLDGRTLVVLDRESRQVVRDTHHVPRDLLAGAFRAHGYSWQDADPYADLYRRWIPDTADLPPAVNAVLSAREIALKKKAAQEVREMRDAVEKLGFAVREDGARQHWRPLVRS
jgi:hypothetical protein